MFYDNDNALLAFYVAVSAFWVLLLFFFCLSYIVVYRQIRDVAYACRLFTMSTK